jgi:hypothetical protein
MRPVFDLVAGLTTFGVLFAGIGGLTIAGLRQISRRR